MDIAASIQKVTEVVVLKILTSLKKEYGQNNLCLAGGVFKLCCKRNNIKKFLKIFGYNLFLDHYLFFIFS